MVLQAPAARSPWKRLYIKYCKKVISKDERLPEITSSSCLRHDTILLGRQIRAYAASS